MASPLMAQVADGNSTFTREQWLDKNNEVFSRYDENSDGFLDREELEKVFDALDQDDDGRIGAVEAFWPQFDRNKDSWIEAEEFTQTCILSVKCSGNTGILGFFLAARLVWGHSGVTKKGRQI